MAATVGFLVSGNALMCWGSVLGSFFVASLTQRKEGSSVYVLFWFFFWGFFLDVKWGCHVIWTERYSAHTHKGGQTFIVSAFSYAVYVSKGLPRVLRFREKNSQNSYMNLSPPKKMQDIRCQEFNAASSLWPTQQRDVSRQKFQFYNSSSSKNSAGAKARIYFFGPCQSVFSRLFRTLFAAHIQ